MDNVTYNSDKVFLYKQLEKQVFTIQLENGSITMMPKPPSGKPLNNFIGFLKDRGINRVVSLLQYDEINRFALVNEGSECKNFEIDFINFQIKDHSVPQFFVPFNQLIEELSSEVLQGKNIAIHCFAGIGRTGLTAASILIKQGLQVDSALITLSRARGQRVPETLEQISWLHRYSEQLHV